MLQQFLHYDADKPRNMESVGFRQLYITLRTVYWLGFVRRLYLKLKIRAVFQEPIPFPKRCFHFYFKNRKSMNQILNDFNKELEFAEYNQQDANFHICFISVRRSTCFRRFFRLSSGAQNCTYVRYLSDRYCYLLLACRLAAGSSIGLTNT